MNSLHKTLAVALLAVIIFISVMGPEAVAAEDSGQESVTIQLRWTHQFQFAGYYAAV
jgi:ABC-type nitrate/sulfonate/bicarbonate transport system substrate-binding protein